MPSSLLSRGARRLGVSLPSGGLRQFEVYRTLLGTWGKKINLSGHLQKDEIIVHHFLDSLSAFSLLGSEEGQRVVDIGTGAGFPGLPLKICRPSMDLTLIERRAKRAAFCREVIRKTGVVDVRVVTATVEDFSRQIGEGERYGWVISRAVAPSAQLLRLSVPLMDDTGRVLLFKGRLSATEVLDLARAAKALGMAVAIFPVSVPFLDGARSFVVAARCSTWNIRCLSL